MKSTVKRGMRSRDSLRRGACFDTAEPTGTMDDRLQTIWLGDGRFELMMYARNESKKHLVVANQVRFAKMIDNHLTHSVISVC